MPKTYYDSEFTAAEIESVLTAIDGVVNPGNNGKVLYIEDGQIKAASASRWSGGYPEPTGTIPITANGTVNVKDYETAEVNVPSSITAADEGKVVKNGALVAQTARATEITANGTYDTTENNSVTVNVSGGGSAETASLFRWYFNNATTCWGIMKKLTGAVIGQNGDNANANIALVGDLMTVTFHGTSQAVEVVANTAIKLKAYTTGRTLGPATMTEYTMLANDQQNFTTDALYGGLYLEAESA